jgi:hypothetical protein
MKIKSRCPALLIAPGGTWRAIESVGNTRRSAGFQACRIADFQIGSIRRGICLHQLARTPGLAWANDFCWRRREKR